MRRYPIYILILYFCFLNKSHAQLLNDSLSNYRPKVALVLSGGGARGAAHIGAIRFIEEMRIPIDIVTGTSMGAIIGALYAIGYTPDEMDSLLMEQDWNMLLSNDVPRPLQPYILRQTEQQYQINIPYTSNGRSEGTARYRDAGIKVQKHSLRKFPKVLTRPGLIDGQNLSNLFTQLTIAYHDSVSFHDFPRSFACVATDLVKGDAVVLDRGFLAESMRASMSIPGVFYPIYKGGQVLVDGGVVNNYPVDVARSMGADIVIGVDLSGNTTPSDILQTFPGIFECLISTLGSDLRRRNIQSTDILIRPQVRSFPVMGFDTTRLSQLVQIGYRAAQGQKEELEELRNRLMIAPSPSVDPDIPALSSPQSYLLSQIECSDDIRLMLRNDGFTEGTMVTSSQLTEMIERIYGLGIYSAVKYHLLGNGPYILDIETQPNPTNQVELGLRFDSEETASLLLNVGINRLQFNGPKFDLTTRFSLNPSIEGHAAYAFHQSLQANIALRYRISDVNRIYGKSNHAFSFQCYDADVYLSNLLSCYYDLRLGARYEQFLVHSLLPDAFPTSSYCSSNTPYFTCYVSLCNDLLNASYFPTTGYAYGIEAAYTISSQKRSNGAFFTIQGYASSAFALGNTTTIQPSLHLRWMFGDAIPFVYGNVMGGYLAGRYLRQQIPFMGFIGYEFMHRQLTVAGIGVRQLLFSDVYLSLIANYGSSVDKLERIFNTQGVWGMSLGLTYNTTIGPLSAYGYWNDRFHRLGAYLSVGYDF